MTDLSRRASAAAADAAPAEEMVEPLVDTAAQEDLADALGAEDFAELVQTYLAALPASLAKVDAAVRDGTGPAIASSAHAIKDGAANMGFLRLSADAGRLEQAAKAGAATLDGLLAALHASADATLATAQNANSPA